MKKLLILSICLGSLSLLSAQQSAQMNMSQTAASDSQLSAAISKALNTAQIGQDQISVNVADGNVTLSGSINTNNDKAYVEEIVSGIRGIKSVNNQIVVLKKSPNFSSPIPPNTTIIRDAASQVQRVIPDTVIAANITDALHRSLNLYNISVEVSNGNVILVGNTATQDDKSQIEHVVKDIEGVKSIDNRVVVGPKKTIIEPLPAPPANVYAPPAQPTPVPATVPVPQPATLPANPANPYPYDYAATESDRQINKHIRRLQYATSPTIVLKTNNGIVTIEGTARTLDEIRILGDTAKNIKGVQSVNNFVVVDIQ